MCSFAVQPDPVGDVYAQREYERQSWLDRGGERLARRLRNGVQYRRGNLARFVGSVADYAGEFDRLSDAELRDAVKSVRQALRVRGFDKRATARAFALVREVAGRTIGQRHYDVQLIGGWLMLNGTVAEMEAGEGKTLAATLSASTAALAGLPVHVITVNDYLAARDAAWMGPVYRMLGLSVGTVTEGLDTAARRASYHCDITYCSNKQVAFDYLRDLLILGHQPGPLSLQIESLFSEQPRLRRVVMRGLYFCIVDEADAVLIDEARTPLVISREGSAEDNAQIYTQAIALAAVLERDHDYHIEDREHRVIISDQGKVRLTELVRPLSGLWSGSRLREELVRTALAALHFYQRDDHYLVQNGRVEIIDYSTGRAMADRSWARGLQQMIEAKEGCTVTLEEEVLARISYQQFFRRYLYLSGMTSTAREVAGELASVYGLNVMRVPRNRPFKRRRNATRVYASSGNKWNAVLERVQEIHETGRPVLIGTGSVQASEHLSRRLSAAGLDHRVLTGRQHEHEAKIIAQAGEPLRITVTTNMAGRGTHIRLSPDVAGLGGLHVIATEPHEAKRIDRQLFGRCGRQGDPGSFEATISLEDELIRMYTPRWLLRFLNQLIVRGWARGLANYLGGIFHAVAQQAAERRHAIVRADLLKLDEHRSRLLAFSGHGE